MGKPSVLVLPAEAMPGASHTVHFPGFPGVYMPDEPVELAELGMSADEAKERIAELGLPLEVVEPKPKKPAEGKAAKE